jgi:hypothetical protein
MRPKYYYLPRASVAIALVVLMSMPIGSVAGLPPLEADGTDAPDAPLQQQGGPKLVTTPYFVRTQGGTAVAGGTLNPAVINESSPIAEIVAPGQPFPRFLLTRVGVFEMQVQETLEVHAVDYCVVWARADEPVQNVRFTIRLERNGNLVADYHASSMQLETTPVAFEAGDVGPLNNPVVFTPGSRLGMEILYTSNSRRGFGPNPGCVVLANSWSYATRFELRVRPIKMNITSPIIENDQVLVTTRIIDSAGLSPKDDEIFVHLNIIPSSGTTAEIELEHVVMGPTSQSIEDGAWVTNWTWDYKKSHAISGLYEFIVDCSYGVKDINYTNSTFFEITFPEEKGSGGILSVLGPMGIGGLAAAIILLAVVVLLVRRQRSRSYYAAGYGYPETEPPRPERAPKRSRFRRKSKEMPPPTPAPTRPGPAAPTPRGRPPPARAPPGAPHAAGAPPRGGPPRGKPPRGMPPKGKPPKGMPPRGKPPRGMPPKGKPPKGMPPPREGPPRRRPEKRPTRPWRG